MTEINDFLSMGGYGAYVWSAYAITFAVLLSNVLITRQQYKKAKQLATRRAQQKKSAHS